MSVTPKSLASLSVVFFVAAMVFQFGLSDGRPGPAVPFTVAQNTCGFAMIICWSLAWALLGYALGKRP